MSQQQKKKGSSFYAAPDVIAMCERVVGRLPKADAIRALFQWIVRYPEFRAAVFDSSSDEERHKNMVEAIAKFRERHCPEPSAEDVKWAKSVLAQAQKLEHESDQQSNGKRRA